MSIVLGRTLSATLLISDVTEMLAQAEQDAADGELAAFNAPADGATGEPERNELASCLDNTYRRWGQLAVAIQHVRLAAASLALADASLREVLEEFEPMPPELVNWAENGF